MQEPSTLLHTPSMQLWEQLRIQFTPYVILSHSNKQVFLHFYFAYLKVHVLVIKMEWKFKLIVFRFMLTYILLLQKGSTYPESHPLSQCPFVELQVALSKQFPLQWWLQSRPNVPFSQSEISNFKKTDFRKDTKKNLFKNVFVFLHIFFNIVIIMRKGLVNVH